MTSTLSPAELKAQLRQFTGSEVFFRHPLNRSVIFTDGVRFLAEAAEAFWLVDAIASYFGSPEMRAAIEEDERLASLQFWTLKVVDGRGELALIADLGEPAAIKQSISFTDFPLPEVSIWAGFSGDFWTLYLPSEH